jgi:acyl-CoA hydrolase
MAAQRHCGKEVVTAGIDSLAFKEPIRIGDHVALKATVNYVSRSSMEVGVQVTREDPYTGQKFMATTAYLTLVALDENKKPSPAPPILPQSDAPKRRRKTTLRKRQTPRPGQERAPEKNALSFSNPPETWPFNEKSKGLFFNGSTFNCMRIDHRGFHVAMAQQFLNSPNVISGLQEMAGINA